MKTLLAIALLCVPAFAQQVNVDIVPASPGLNIGHSNQRWNGNFGSLDVSNLTINGTALNVAFGFINPCLTSNSAAVFLTPGQVVSCTAGITINPGIENSISLPDNTSVTDAGTGSWKIGSVNGLVEVGFGGPLSAIETAANVGAVNGIAGLDGAATVPIAQIVTSTTNCNGTHVILGNKTCGTIAGTGSGLLNSQGPAGQVTGTGALTNIYTYSIPGGTMSATSCIRATVWAHHSTGSTGFPYSWNFAGTSIAYASNAGSGSANASITICNNAATNVQYLSASNITIGTATLAGGIATSAVDTTSAQSISFQFNVASSDKVTPDAFTVESIH